MWGKRHVGQGVADSRWALGPVRSMSDAALTAATRLRPSRSQPAGGSATVRLPLPHAEDAVFCFSAQLSTFARQSACAGAGSMLQLGGHLATLVAVAGTHPSQEVDNWKHYG